jgi:signal transduction histidine kinase
MAEVEKLAAVGQLAAGVAHELNNPLSGIMGYADVAIERYREKPPEIMTPEDAVRMVGYFSHIQSLTHRCRAIILDMLTFARHHTEEVGPLAVNDVIRQTLAFLEKEFDRTRVFLSVDLAEGIAPVQGNATQLQQVFTNLIINAIHAMPGGGTLAVRSRVNGTALEIAFRDVGVGIDPALQRRIFEPFVTTKRTGTGLGLAIVRALVHAHGGRVVAETPTEGGAVFRVILTAH